MIHRPFAIDRMTFPHALRSERTCTRMRPRHPRSWIVAPRPAPVQYAAPVEPRTLSEQSEEVASGSRIAVRAAAFSVASALRGAVSLTVRVPAELGHVKPEDGSVVGTVLLDPVEARGLAEWLRDAAEQAETVGPGLYSDPDPAP